MSFFSFVNPWVPSDVPYYLASPDAIGAASPQSQGLLDLFTLLNDPNVRRGFAYNYGQDAVRHMGGAFAQATKDKLDYARTLAGSRAQVTTGGSVPPAQLQAWTPDTILRLMQLLAPRG